MSLPHDDELAGEYVLGTLSAMRRREVEQRLASDAGLQAAVQRWHERLLPLASLAEPVEPSAQLWRRIEASVEQAAVSSQAPAQPAPAAPRRAAPPGPRRRPAGGTA